MAETDHDNGLNAELMQAKTWLDEGKGVVLATVVATWGSSPRPIGSHLVIDEFSHFFGSVSGGCIEGAVVQKAQEVLSDGKPRLVEFGVSKEQAWEVGLSCGGAIRISLIPLVTSSLFDRVCAEHCARKPVAWAVRLSDGAQAIVTSEKLFGERPLSAELLELARSELKSGRSALLDSEGEPWFVRVYSPAPRLALIGAVHISQALAPMAAMLGFDVTVIDPRRAFASRERFPGIKLVEDWPDDALREFSPDVSTALVTLTHDPKLDDPALEIGLNSPAFYIGALGSKRTHAQRVVRLNEQGLGDEVGRIHAPVGLNLGGRSPQEISVAIMAQVIQARYGA